MTPLEKVVRESAEYIAYLISVISPGINEEETAELLFEMLMHEPTEEIARSYGELIRATAIPTSKTQH